MRSVLLGMAVGLVAGLGFGWFAFRREVGPPFERSSSQPPRPSSPVLEAAPAARDSAARSPAERLPSTFARGTAAEIWKVLNPQSGDRRVTSDEARDLVARLDESIRRGDSQLFLAVVEGLGRSDEQFAQEALVAILAREDLPLPAGSGGRFGRALARSGVPGIAAAARIRFDQAIAAGETSWAAADGWFELVGLHGGAEDIAWLAERRESTQIRARAAQALALSPHPEAMRRFLEAVRSRDPRDPAQPEIWTFVEHHPEEGWVLLDELFAKADTDLAEVLRGYAHAVPLDRLPDAKRRLLSLADDRSRIAAVYAVESLSQRGLDISDLEPLILAPVLYLERQQRPADGANDPLVTAGIYAIEYNRVTWSERAARALENVSWSSGGSDPLKVAALVRAGIRSPWKR